MLVPNIVNVSFGRSVGCKLEEGILDGQTYFISATKIRAILRRNGPYKVLGAKPKSNLSRMIVEQAL